MNTHLRDNLNFLFGAPRCRIRHSVAQTNGGTLLLAFDTEDFDNNVMHDPVTNNSRATIKTAGTYLFMATIFFDAHTVGIRELIWFVNGISTAQGQKVNATTSEGCALSAMMLRSFVVNDYVQLQARQTSGVPLNILSGGASAGEHPRLEAVFQGN